MKHLLLSAILLAAATSASAVPAKRGQWQTIQLANGGTARVQLAGDEYMHWLQAEDGSRYQLDENTGLYSLISAEHSEKLASRAAARRSVVQTGAKRAARIGHPNDKSVFQGTKKGIVILIDYPNRKFQDVIDLVNEGKVDLRGSISHTWNFEDAQAAFDFVDSRDPSYRKGVLTFKK